MDTTNVVLEKVCDEKHKSIEDKLRVADTRLNDHTHRIGSVEDAVIQLTNMVDSIAKRDIFDKILIVSIFIVALVLAGIVLGPGLTKEIIGSIK